MTTAKNILKQWFVRGAKPLAVQFAAWIDSYWHKDEKIPAVQVEGLQEAFDSKADSEAFNSTVQDLKAGLAQHNTSETAHAAMRETVDRIDTKVAMLDNLKAVAFSGAYSDLSGMPASLPANGGNADTISNMSIEQLQAPFNEAIITINGETKYLVNNPEFIINYSELSEDIIYKTNLSFIENELKSNNLFVCSVNASSAISLAADLTIGKSYTVVIKNTDDSEITITRPTDADSTNTSSFKIAAGKEREVSVWYDGAKRRWLISEEM